MDEPKGGGGDPCLGRKAGSCTGKGNSNLCLHRNHTIGGGLRRSAESVHLLDGRVYVVRYAHWLSVSWDLIHGRRTVNLEEHGDCIAREEHGAVWAVNLEQCARPPTVGNIPELLL